MDPGEDLGFHLSSGNFWSVCVFESSLKPHFKNIIERERKRGSSRPRLRSSQELVVPWTRVIVVKVGRSS